MNKINILLLLVAISSPFIEASRNIRLHNAPLRMSHRRVLPKRVANEFDDLLFPEGRLALRGQNKITRRDQIHLLFTIPVKGDAEPDEKDYQLVKGLRELDDLQSLIEGEEILVSITKQNLIDFVKGVAHGIGRALGDPDKCVKEVPAIATYFSQAATYLRNGWNNKDSGAMKNGLIALGKAIKNFADALNDCGVVSLVKAIIKIAGELETGSWLVVLKDHIMSVLRNGKDMVKLVVAIADAWVSKSWYKAGDALGYLLGLILTSGGEGFVLPSIPVFVPGCASCVALPSPTELGSANLLLSGAIFASFGTQNKNEDIVKAALAEYRDAMYLLSYELAECTELKDVRKKLIKAYSNIDLAFKSNKVEVSFSENGWKMNIAGKAVGDVISDISTDIIGAESVSAGENFMKLVNFFA